jgi:hypothetical protein
MAAEAEAPAKRGASNLKREEGKRGTERRREKAELSGTGISNKAVSFSSLFSPAVADCGAEKQREIYCPLLFFPYFPLLPRRLSSVSQRHLQRNLSPKGFSLSSSSLTGLNRGRPNKAASAAVTKEEEEKK